MAEVSLGTVHHSPQGLVTGSPPLGPVLTAFDTPIPTPSPHRQLVQSLLIQPACSWPPSETAQRRKTAG